MNLEDQRREIAKACDIQAIDKHWMGWSYDGIEMPGDMPIYFKVPDYPRDLQAMQRAISELSKRNRKFFSEELLTVLLHANVLGDYPVTMRTQDVESELCGELDLVYHITQATSLQLAEAFLRTIKRWKK